MEKKNYRTVQTTEKKLHITKPAEIIIIIIIIIFFFFFIISSNNTHIKARHTDYDRQKKRYGINAFTYRKRKHELTHELHSRYRMYQQFALRHIETRLKKSIQRSAYMPKYMPDLVAN